MKRRRVKSEHIPGYHDYLFARLVAEGYRCPVVTSQLVGGKWAVVDYDWWDRDR